MKFSLLKPLAIAGLFASVIANPVALRQESSAISLLTDLFATVQTYTGAINATLATLTSTSSDADKAAALASVGTELTGLTGAITAATTSVKSLIPVSKRSDIQARQLDPTQLPIIAAELAALLAEIFATVSSAVALLGLTGLLSFLNPLTGGLGGLILAVEVLVDFLLLTVTLLLDGLLTGLGLALGGIAL